MRSAGCHYPVNYTSEKITREDFVHIHYVQSPFANEADGKKRQVNTGIEPEISFTYIIDFQGLMLSSIKIFNNKISLKLHQYIFLK